MISYLLQRKSKLVYFCVIILFILGLQQSSHTELVNTETSSEKNELLNYLNQMEGKGILSGQQELYNAEWIKTNTGVYPAIVGFDLYNYSSALKLENNSDQIEQAIQWHKKGGIVTFCWHWVAPNMKFSVHREQGYYSKYTNFDIAYAMDHHHSREYLMLLKDIGLIADQLKRLQVAHIPVLFRPLHEAEGGWFWWGSKGPKPAIKLYKLLYNQLTYKYKLNNLIWVWNSSSPVWYPGDRYVDIISYDSYPQAGDTGTVESEYLKTKILGHGQKLVAMSENSTIPDPNKLNESDVNWIWFMTWRDNFLTDGKYNSLEYIRMVYNNPYVITLDKLPNVIKKDH